SAHSVTYNTEPSGLSAAHTGSAPKASVLSTTGWPLPRPETRCTLLAPRLTTKAWLAFGATTTASGCASTATSIRELPLAVSKTETELPSVLTATTSLSFSATSIDVQREGRASFGRP